MIYRARIDYEAITTESRTATVSIEVPEGATGADIDAALFDALAADASPDAEIGDWHETWIDGPPVPAECRPEAPGWAWQEWNGFRWATDGALAIREDAPRPDGMTWGFYTSEWQRPDRAVIGSLPDDCIPPLGTEPDSDARYAPRMSPILRAGVVCGPLANDRAHPAAVYRGGELIALVMPVFRHGGGPCVDYRGELVGGEE